MVLLCCKAFGVFLVVVGGTDDDDGWSPRVVVRGDSTALHFQ